MIIPNEGKITLRIANDKGQIIRTNEIQGSKGINTISIDDLHIYSNGLYFIFIDYNNETVKKKMIKIN